MYSQDKIITTEYDEFIAQLWEERPRWEVLLSNGTKVYQDDGRYNNPLSAWERLRNYCISEKLYITNFKFGFRDNIKSLPENMNGYYFRKMAKCFLGGDIKQHYIVGFEVNDIIKIGIYSIPEVILDIEEERAIDLEDLSLISKGVVNQNLLEK